MNLFESTKKAQRPENRNLFRGASQKASKNSRKNCRFTCKINEICSTTRRSLVVNKPIWLIYLFYKRSALCFFILPKKAKRSSIKNCNRAVKEWKKYFYARLECHLSFSFPAKTMNGQVRERGRGLELMAYVAPGTSMQYGTILQFFNYRRRRQSF